MHSRSPSHSLLSLGALVGSLAVSGCASSSKESNKSSVPEARSNSSSLVLPPASIYDSLSSQSLTAPRPTSPSLAEKLVATSSELNLLIEKQSAFTTSLGGPSIQLLLEKAGRSNLVGDLLRSRDALVGLEETSPSYRSNLEAWWNNAELLVAAAHSNNLQLQVFARAALKLSELAHNEVLIERFTGELASLRSLSQQLADLSTSAASAVAQNKIDTSPFRVTVQEPEFAPPALEVGWRTVVESALRASKNLAPSGLLTPDQTVGDARADILEAASRPGPLRTSQALQEMLIARFLIRAAFDSFRDDIGVAQIVKEQLEGLPAERRPAALVERAEIEVEKATVRFRMLRADMEEAIKALGRLESLNRSREREFQLNTEGARIRFNR
jgi:hypothetical protein